MTDDDIHTALVRWLANLTGLVVIKSYEGGPEPARPYIEVNFTTRREVREHEQRIDFDEDDTAGEVVARPVIECEWSFSLHAFGTAQPTDLLRPVVSAIKLAQVQEPILPGLVIHEISQIRHIPDYVGEQWRKRAQMDMFLRGVTRDGFVIDVIETTEFDIERD